MPMLPYHEFDWKPSVDVKGLDWFQLQQTIDKKYRECIEQLIYLEELKRVDTRYVDEYYKQHAIHNLIYAHVIIDFGELNFQKYNMNLEDKYYCEMCAWVR